MITRYIILVIVFMNSFFCVSQCPDFNPKLEILGADTICSYNDSVLIGFSFEGDNINHLVELHSNENDPLVDTLKPGYYETYLKYGGDIQLTIRLLDNQICKDTSNIIEIYQQPPSLIDFGGNTYLCKSLDDTAVKYIDFSQVNGLPSFKIKNNDGISVIEEFKYSHEFFEFMTDEPSIYQIVDAKDSNNCEIQIKGSNRYRVWQLNPTNYLIDDFDGLIDQDTLFTTKDSIRFRVSFESRTSPPEWNVSDNLIFKYTNQNVFLSEIQLGINVIGVKAFDTYDACPSIDSKINIIKLEVSKANSGADKILCNTKSDFFNLIGSPSKRFETSEWTDLNGYLGTPNATFNTDSLLIQPPYKKGSYKFVYSIYNTIADSTTSDTLILNIIEEPSFVFDSPFNSSDTVFTNQEEENISITTNESNYEINWNTDFGNITDINYSATEITQLDNQNLSKVSVSVQDSLKVCPVKSDSFWIDRVQQTIAAVDDSLKFCVDELPDTIFSINELLEPRFEKSSWASFNSPQVLTSDTTFILINASVAPGIYYLEYSIENAIVSTTKDTLVLIIDELPQPSNIITSDYITCNNQDTAVAAPLASNNVGIWMDDNQSELSKTEESTFSFKPGENEFLWVVSNGACQFKDTSSVTITYINEVTEPTIVISEMPSGDTFVAIDDTLGLCLKGSYQVGFQPNLLGQESVEWLPGLGTNISDPASNPTTQQQNVTISGVGLKEYILKVEVENGIDCPVNFDTLQIVVIDIPDLSNAFIVKQDTVCENTQNNPITVENVVWGQKYYWLSSSPLLSFQSSDLDSTNYSVGLSPLINEEVDASAEFSVYAENFCGVSDNQITDNVLVRLSPKSFDPYLTKNIETEGKDTLCNNLSSSDVVRFKIKSQFNTENYIWDFPVVGVIEEDSIIELTGSQINQISGSAEGAKTISVSLENECGSYGPVSEEVQFQKTEPFSFSLNLPEGENVCPEKMYSIEVNSVFKDSVLLQFSNSTFIERTVLPRTFLIEGDSLLNNLGPQLVASAEIVDKELCYAEFEDQKAVTLTNVGLSKPSLDQPEPTCYGNEIILQENTQQNNYLQGYNWYKNNSIVKESAESFIALEQVDESGIYKVELISLYDCESQISDEVEVQILENPILTIADKYKPTKGQGLDVFVKENQNVTSQLPFELDYSGSENLIYNWNVFSANNIISESEAQSFLSNLNTHNPDLVVNSYKEDEIIYVLNVVTGLGCSASDSVLVNFIKPFIAPTAFTPNGDNINDTWVLDGLTKFPDAVVSVFNRWGTLVFQKYGGYQGHFSGYDLPMGTYYWVVDFKDDSKEPASGSVTIIK